MRTGSNPLVQRFAMSSAALARMRAIKVNELEASPFQCAECSSLTGPDRHGRWESGVPRDQLGLWARCNRCGALLCDSCALGGAHECEATS